MRTPATKNETVDYRILKADLAALKSENSRFRLVGSLGRAVHHAALGNPYREYEVRSQHPLYTPAGLRDIDTIGLSASPDTTFPVDTAAHTHNTQVTILPDGDDWWLVSQERNFAEQIHIDVMQPVEGATVGGINTVTIPWQTQLALTRSRGFPRKKDRLSMDLLEKTANDALLPKLPSELLAPFERLNEIHVPAHQLAIRAIYRSLPSPITQVTTPILRRFKTPQRNPNLGNVAATK